MTTPADVKIPYKFDFYRPLERSGTRYPCAKGTTAYSVFSILFSIPSNIFQRLYPEVGDLMQVRKRSEL